jgi:hydrogenase maturation protein HypF
MELEALARSVQVNDDYPVSIIENGPDQVSDMDTQPLILAILEDLEADTDKALIARRFHNSLARLILLACENVRATTELRTVALSGGVFQNRLLTTTSISLLEGAGFRVLTHKQVPCNDGGISLGQAAVAHFIRLD